MIAIEILDLLINNQDIQIMIIKYIDLPIHDQ